MLHATHNNTDMLSVCRNNGDYIDGSCISTQLLKKIAKSLEIPLNIPRRRLIMLINKKLNLTSDTQHLIIYTKLFNRLPDTDKYMLTHSFKPFGPVKHEWLSNININDVMERYELDYNDFKFIDATYCDFLYYPENNQYKTLDFFKLNNKNKFAMVINQDVHTGPGTHWVALYFDRLGEIYYFDSVGMPPKKPVNDFIDLLKNYYIQNGIKPRVIINTREHQQGNSECGVYSIMFIVRLLEGENIDNIINNIIHDSIMEQFRKFLFNVV